MLLTIDGQKWSSPKGSLKSLASDITSTDDNSRRKSLERFEDYGLNGFVSDLGQLILLFARGGVARYEFQLEKEDDEGAQVFTYQQLDGKESLTVFGEGEEPIRQKLHGRIWVQLGTGLPLKVSVESSREAQGGGLTDISSVEYEPSKFGTLLPAHVTHKQYLGPTLLVTDEYVYSGYKQILRGGR